MEKDLIELLDDLKKINYDEKLDDVLNAHVLKLAYVGDTIFDLFTRNYLVKKYADTIKIGDLHKKNSDLVCAKSQSKISDYLVDNVFTEEEVDFFKHARNAHSNSKSKNSSIVEYRKATGLEATLGLLFYKDGKRLVKVLDKIAAILE